MIWVCHSLLNLIRVLILSLLLKLPSRKLELWFVLWSFFFLFFLSLLYIYEPTIHLAWNAVVMSGLVLLAASWNCFLIGFSVCFNLFVLLFLVNPCLAMAFQLCMEWIPIRKKLLNWCVINNFHFCVLLLVRNSPQATFAGIIMNNKWEWKTGCGITLGGILYLSWIFLRYLGVGLSN